MPAGLEEDLLREEILAELSPHEKVKGQYRFFYHYNKPESRKAGSPKITLHYKGECHIVDGLDIKVFTESKFNNQQPRFVIQGWSSEIKIDKNTNKVVIFP